MDRYTCIIGASVLFLIGALFGAWVVYPSSPSSEPINYQMKYAEEVCKQRNADVHRLGRLNYLVCMDKTTKVLSDFD